MITDSHAAAMSGNFPNFCVPLRMRKVARAGAGTRPAVPTSTAMPAKCCHSPRSAACTRQSGRVEVQLHLAGSRQQMLATAKVPIASRVFRSVPARVSRIAGVSVCGPWNPWQSAFCSPPVLQLRRFAHGRKRKFWNQSLYLFFKYLDHHS